MTTNQLSMTAKVARNENRILDVLGKIIFSIRWGLVPLYVGLYVAIGAYVYKFGQEIYEMVAHLPSMRSEDLLLSVLGLIDITMIGNLIVMTTVGGYLIFVNSRAFDSIADKPRWLNGIDSTTLKIKMGMSLIGVSAIHLLKTFMEASSLSWDQVGKETTIHLVFCLTTLVYVAISKLAQHGHGTSTDDKGSH